MKIASQELLAHLHQQADAEAAKKALRFFKTGPGEYGEGDRFLGIRVPVLRKLSKQAQDLSLDEIHTLLSSPWHEIRLIALMILGLQFKKAEGKNASLEKELYLFYLQHLPSINNWDLVDSSAPQILGAYLNPRPLEREILYKLVKSKNLWERRVAILASFTFIRAHDFKDALELAKKLLQDKEDLLHKATGWMLREIGKRNEAVLTQFLEKHTTIMSRTMLRYAIERLSKEEKLYYLNLK